VGVVREGEQALHVRWRLSLYVARLFTRVPHAEEIALARL
jgi:hypothetical protein